MARLIYPSLQQPVPFSLVLPVYEADWQQSWSLPVRQRIKSQHAVALAAASGNQFDPFPLPDIVPTTDKYGAVWPTPVRTRPGLRPSQQQFLAFTPAAPFPEDVNYAKFAFPWSNPVKLQKRGLGAALQQPTAQATYFADIVPILFSSYASAWSNPPSLKKRGLNAAQQQAAVTPTFFTDQFPIPFSAYGSTWSVPVKLQKRGLNAALQQTSAAATFFTDQFPIPFSAYGSVWSTPVTLAKPGLATALQQAAIVPTFFVPTPLVPYPGRLYANAIVRDRTLENPSGRDRDLVNVEVRVRFLGYRKTTLQ